MNGNGHRNSMLTAGLILGAGLGGFADGILFHQILQLHNMRSADYPVDTLVNAEINMFWDGLFHAFTWLTTCFGLFVLWRGFLQENSVPPTRAFVGSLFVGWGLFNCIEGVIDHHILNLHHVVERLGPSRWDYAFLGSGILFFVLGWTLMRGSERQHQIFSRSRQSMRSI